jgi:hypothetical protein
MFILEMNSVHIESMRYSYLVIVMFIFDDLSEIKNNIENKKLKEKTIEIYIFENKNITKHEKSEYKTVGG